MGVTGESFRFTENSTMGIKKKKNNCSKFGGLPKSRSL